MGELWWQLWQLVCLGFKARAQLYVCAYSCICAWQQNTNVLFWAYRWLKNALPSFWQSKLLKSRQKDYTHQPISTLRPCRGCTQEGHFPWTQTGSISGTMTRLTMKPGRETLQQNYQGQLCMSKSSALVSLSWSNTAAFFDWHRSNQSNESEAVSNNVAYFWLECHH